MATMHMISLKILRFLPIDTSIVVTELVVDIRSKIVISKIIYNVLMNLLKAHTAILAPLVTLPSFTRKSNFNIAVSLS